MLVKTTDRNITAVLRERADSTPEQVIFRFFTRLDEASKAVTFAQLDQRAKAVAATLQELGSENRSVQR